jgi:hypothetical protein
MFWIQLKCEVSELESLKIFLCHFTFAGQNLEMFHVLDIFLFGTFSLIQPRIKNVSTIKPRNVSCIQTGLNRLLSVEAYFNDVPTCSLPAVTGQGR